MLKQFFCNHRHKDGSSAYEEISHGIFEDVVGGPRTLHYISWKCSKCRKVIGDDLDRDCFPPDIDPGTGFKWSYNIFDNGWRIVCDTCGGNCGQCGLTDKLGNIQTDLGTLIQNTEMYKPPAGFRR